MYATGERPMSQPELDLVGRVWADAGSDDPTDEWLVLWDGGDAGSHPDERDRILAVAASCGLPCEVRDGVLWLRKTHQLHDEIGARWL